MEGSLRWWILILVIITTTKCKFDQSSYASEMESDVSNLVEQGAFPDSVSVEFAKNFSIADFGDYKVARLKFQSDNRSIQFDQKIIFLTKGGSQPVLSGALEGAWIVEVPLHTVAANDDGEITRLKALGFIENIVAMGGGGIYDTELRQRWEAKKIASIGYSFHSPPQPEILLALKPDVLLFYAYDHQRLESVSKLRQLGINAIPQFAWAEDSFLGKAEWIKFSALFFGKEKTANEIFGDIAARCEELMQLVAGQNSRQKAFFGISPI